MENDYKVRWLQDNDWKVVTETKDPHDDWVIESETHYSGNLSDCEAWIRLTNGGQML